MKKLLYLSLLILALGCQNRDKFPSNINPLLTGKWEMTAYYATLSGNDREWKTIDSLTGQPTLIIRSDGAFLFGNGKGMCCGPGGKVTINGEAMFLNPTMPITYDEICQLIDCIICNDNVFEVDEEKLVWMRCGTIRSQYRRLP
ncbi:hypothetical protein [Persicitalea jodogahamensis]|uniref:hypothetical protein n=1 Tax=Persicitalea jodogahamensis TaxID=402147 RepID=UPI0016770243|nr:hypothetical protein [Persicitalea jodogahamensis]